MATSKIRIYATKLTPARNALVDYLDTYLASLTPTYTNDNFQYQKLALDLTVKVPMPQDVISNHSLGNYVVIEQDNKKWYYFLLNCHWTSPNTVLLNLSIDSINTFKSDLTFDDKTLITRQHKDRFEKRGNNLMRIVDRISENITVQQKQLSVSTLRQSNRDFNWYLIFKTRDDLSETNLTNPVGVYLCASQQLQLSGGTTTSKTITAADLIEGNYYYFTDIDNAVGAWQMRINAQNTVSSSIGQSVSVYLNTSTKVGATVRGITLHRKDNKLYAGLVYNTPVGYVSTSGYITSSLTSPTNAASTQPLPTALSDMPCIAIENVTFTQGNFMRISSGFVSYPEGTVNFTGRFPIYTGQGQVVIDFNSVNKTDSKLIKILKLPYAPVNITYDTTNKLYTFPATWSYQSNGLMKLDDAALSDGFLNNNLPYTQITEMFMPVPTYDGHALRNINYESKLFNSAFYTYKLVYDSFSYDIALERVKPTSGQSSAQWTFEFKTTSTINSKFMFKFRPVNYTYEMFGDYDNYLMITRNNEEPIYNNDYVNYIRTGYNYDQKVRQQQLQQNILNGVIQGATAAANLFVPGTYQKIGGVSEFTSGSLSGAIAHAKADPEYKFGFGLREGDFTYSQGVRSAGSAAQSIISAIYSSIQAQQAIDQKRLQLSQQSTAVSGSDDIDLLSYYNTNRLQLFKYQATDEDRQKLFDLFYYTGYACNYHSKPNTTSRYWFNFIQCTPEFIEEGTSPYNDYIDDVKARYQAGVTVYHVHDNEYDWEQKYENWEKTLLAQA